jgi:hypothetical protein
MAFKKGSKEAKAYMKKVREAKINGLKKKVKDKRQLSIFDQAPIKKAVTKKAVTKKSVAPRKKVVTKKSVAPRKKVVTKKVTIPRTKKELETFYKNERAKYLDSLRPALLKGKRVSENGNVYYEYRDNRSDVRQKGKRGQLLGVNGINNNVLSEISRLTKFNNEIEKYILDQTKRLKTDKSENFLSQKRFVQSSILRYKDLLKYNKKPSFFKGG